MVNVGLVPYHCKGNGLRDFFFTKKEQSLSSKYKLSAFEERSCLSKGGLALFLFF